VKIRGGASRKILHSPGGLAVAKVRPAFAEVAGRIRRRRRIGSVSVRVRGSCWPVRCLRGVYGVERSLNYADLLAN